jgi:hypothetical protein
MKVLLDHKGWFGLCPCYFGAIESEAPYVEPRLGIFAPLLWFSEFMYRLMGMCLPGDEGSFVLHVTGKLLKPIEMEVGDAD